MTMMHAAAPGATPRAPSGRAGAIGTLLALLSTLLLLPAGSTAAAITRSVTSPDGAVRFDLTEQDDGSLTYQVTLDGQPLLDPSPLGITADGVDLSSGLAFVSQSTRVVDETYSLPGRKLGQYINRANELTLRYSKGGRTMELVVQAHDDGVAYRYALPGSGTATISDERSGFRMRPGTGAWASNYRTRGEDYEDVYPYRTVAQLDRPLDQPVDESRDDSFSGLSMPVLLSVQDNARWALVTEAAVYNSRGSSAASRLTGLGDGSRVLRVVPPPEEPVTTTTYPFQTPWRVLIVADGLETLVRSTLVTDLNPPSVVGDTSWIRPGRAAWSWWSDEYWDLNVPGTSTPLDKQKRYVDFAASQGWEYITVDCCWRPRGEQDWPSSLVPYRPWPDFQDYVPDIVTYARTRGVDVLLWTNKDALDTQEERDAEFALWTSWGVAGLKIDFFQSDTRATMGVYDAIARDAARHQLVVNFHGNTKPSGESRTFPHVLTSEAVLGSEQYRYGRAPTARHNATIPFTRNVIGPMDYTPVTFSQHDSNTTQGHELALSVVFESHLQHFADSDGTYAHWPGRHLLRAVPTVWDDLRLVEGFPDSHVTMARRSGDDWYVGAITDASRTARIPLTLLGDGTHTATIFTDGASGSDLRSQRRSVTRDSVLELDLRTSGGAAVHISRTPLAFDGQADASWEAEAPGNTLAGTSASSCPGCSGAGKVGDIGYGSTLTFNGVHAAVTGPHQLTLSYASRDVREVQLTVNGVALPPRELPYTGGWDVVGTATFDVALTAGANTIQVGNPSGYAPNLDRISTAVSYEAEAGGNSLEGGASAVLCGGCSGGAKVGNLYGAGAVTFNGVGAVGSGSKTVTVHYTGGDMRSAEFRVNGGPPLTVDLPATGGWSTIGTRTIALPLTDGLNTVTVSRPGGYAPDLDRLVVAG